jgi:hypothetical protein
MNEPSPSITPAPDLPRKKNKAWIWYFVFLVVASVGVAVFMICFNLAMQLKPEALHAARQLWNEKGPRNYKLKYTKLLNDNPTSETFVVIVRAGIVQEVLMNGKPLEPEQRPYYRMESHFNHIERFMDLDQKPGRPKVFVTAIFDDKTGALHRYVRRVMGTTRERVEMRFNLEELPN